MRSEVELFESGFVVQMRLGVERGLIISMRGISATKEALSTLAKDPDFIPFSDRWRRRALSGRRLGSFNKSKAWEDVPTRMDQLVGDIEAWKIILSYIEYDKKYEVSFLAQYFEYQVTYIYPNTLRVTTIY